MVQILGILKLHNSCYEVFAEPYLTYTCKSCHFFMWCTNYFHCALKNINWCEVFPLKIGAVESTNCLLVVQQDLSWIDFLSTILLSNFDLNLLEEGGPLKSTATYFCSGCLFPGSGSHKYLIFYRFCCPLSFFIPSDHDRT